MTSGIYAIVHKASGRRYIGSSVDIESRWLMHRKSLNVGDHFNPPLANAWAKYGAEAFEFTVVEQCEESHLLDREQVWLDTSWHSGMLYNVNPIAGKPPSARGTRHSKEHREKLSASWTEDRKAAHIERSRRANSGRKQSPETIQKRVEKLRGKTRSPEVRAQMSERAKASGRRPPSRLGKNEGRV